MFLGFFAWYAGLARGGVARVGQIQLTQPVLTLLWSALLLAETVTPASIGAALVVLACVVLIQRTRTAPAQAQDLTDGDLTREVGRAADATGRTPPPRRGRIPPVSGRPVEGRPPAGGSGR